MILHIIPIIALVQVEYVVPKSRRCESRQTNVVIEGYRVFDNTFTLAEGFV